QPSNRFLHDTLPISFSNPRRSNSSRRKETSQPEVSSGSISSGGGPAWESAARSNGSVSLPLRLGFAVAFAVDRFASCVLVARETSEEDTSERQSLLD